MEQTAFETGEGADDLIRDIYDTILHPRRWPDILERVAARIGAEGAFVLDIEPDGAGRRIVARHFTGNYDPALVSEYMDHHQAKELSDQDVLTRVVGADDEIVLVPDAILRQPDRPLNEAWRLIDSRLGWRAGALLNKDRNDQDRFALQFAEGSVPFGPGHFRRAAQLLPHLAKAFDLGRSIEAARAASHVVAATFERLAIGVAVLDGRGRVTFCNAEFRRQMEETGLLRVNAQGAMELGVRTQSAELRRLLAGLAAHGRHGARPRKEAVIATRAGQTRLMVEATPLASAPDLDHADRDGHLLYTIDISRGFKVDEPRLQRLFKLTQAESSVLALLAEGLSNAEIAERRETSVMTTRAQLKSVFSKLEASNRVQAVRIAASVSNAFLRRESA